MIDVLIRPVRPEDLEEVTNVEAICFPAAEAASKESFRERIAAFADERTIRDEMFADSSLHNPEGIYQSIFGLAVIPEYQRQGIGAKLMNHLIENAREKGRKGLSLTCKDYRVHYYAKFGYQNLGVSASVHVGAVWYDMLLEFAD